MHRNSFLRYATVTVSLCFPIKPEACISLPNLRTFLCLTSCQRNFHYFMRQCNDFLFPLCVATRGSLRPQWPTKQYDLSYPRIFPYLTLIYKLFATRQRNGSSVLGYVYLCLSSSPVTYRTTVCSFVSQYISLFNFPISILYFYR